jgi:hypothetical protein
LSTDANANCIELEINNLEDNDTVNEYNDPSWDLEGDNKWEGEVAADIAQSDAVDVDHAAEEADLDGCLDLLLQAVRVASALSITKVRVPLYPSSFTANLLSFSAPKTWCQDCPQPHHSQSTI